tara:strand:+ start:180 stop:650 length:471 start_codon:yes stop_codon:yes gene_type:complete
MANIFSNMCKKEPRTVLKENIKRELTTGEDRYIFLIFACRELNFAYKKVIDDRLVSKRKDVTFKLSGDHTIVLRNVEYTDDRILVEFRKGTRKCTYLFEYYGAIETRVLSEYKLAIMFLSAIRHYWQNRNLDIDEVTYRTSNEHTFEAKMIRWSVV